MSGYHDLNDFLNENDKRIINDKFLHSVLVLGY